MRRHQRGYLYEHNDAFHVRYLITTADGRRTQKSQKLCDKDREHASKRSRAVQRLRDEHMAMVNARDGHSVSPGTKVSDFFERYLSLKTFKPSSEYAVKQIWNQHLRDHFADATLEGYRRASCTEFLLRLKKRGLGANTIRHVKFAMSSIFALAVTLDVIDANPIQAVRVKDLNLAKTEETEAYEMPEVIDAFDALKDEAESRLFFALLTLAGLRSNEVIALQWPDFRDAAVRVTRGVSRGVVVDMPKTDASRRIVPLIDVCVWSLEAWRARCGGVTEGWVFPGRFGHLKPGVISAQVRKLKPIFEANGIPWRGTHAGRRCAATILIQLTGSAIAAARALGHANTRITEEIYNKMNKDAEMARGFDLLNARPEVRRLMTSLKS